MSQKKLIMKNLILIFTAFLAIIGVQSCSDDLFEQVVTIDVPAHTSKLALSSSFDNLDTVVRVFVGQSVGILDDSTSQTVSNAQLQLLKNGTSLGTFLPQSNGWQSLKLSAPLREDITAEYTLKANANGFTEVKSTQKMPILVPIVTAKLVIDTTQDMTGSNGGFNENEQNRDKITLEFQDPAGSSEYYIVNILLLVTNRFGSSYYQYIGLRTRDPIAEDNRDGLLIAGNSFDGKKYSLNCSTRVQKEWFSNGNTAKLYVVLSSITKDEFFYKKSLYEYYESSSNPFAEPVIVRSNVENGYGFFGIRAVSKFEFQL